MNSNEQYNNQGQVFCRLQNFHDFMEFDKMSISDWHYRLTVHICAKAAMATAYITLPLASIDNELSIYSAARQTVNWYFRSSMLRYDLICYFNVRSKADMSQLNLPHVVSFN